MKRQVFILRTNEPSEELSSPPTLKEAQAIVGGYVEFVYCKGGVTLVVNEEGIIKYLPLNNLASLIYGAVICGDAILLMGYKTLSKSKKGED